MRSVDNEVICLLDEVKEKFSELRIGQIVMIALSLSTYVGGDVFYMPDKYLKEGLEKMIEEAS